MYEAKIYSQVFELVDSHREDGDFFGTDMYNYGSFQRFNIDLVIREIK